ncbi:MAG: leucine-rich repeat protein [Ruminococcus sp.]|nr:leucine-rich repeat protein [Ruminococcus sp.]
MKKHSLSAIAAAAALLFSVPLTAAADSVSIDGAVLSYSEVSGYDRLITGDITAAAAINGSPEHGAEISIPAVFEANDKKYITAELGDSAFMGYMDVLSITLPEGLQKVGSSVFAGCLSLESITIPSSVNSFGTNVFMSCTALKTADLGGDDSSLTVIPEGCFSSCTALEYVHIPDSVTAIGKEAFFGCSSLTQITIPSSVRYIGENAVGMKYDIRSGTVEPVDDFLIFGKTGSAANLYARSSGIEFLDLSVNEPGDVNRDGLVDSVDASAVLSEYALLATGESGTFTAAQRFLADINSDGEINSLDASDILIVYAERATSR